MKIGDENQDRHVCTYSRSASVGALGNIRENMQARSREEFIRAVYQSVAPHVAEFYSEKHNPLRCRSLAHSDDTRGISCRCGEAPPAVLGMWRHQWNGSARGSARAVRQTRATTAGGDWAARGAARDGMSDKRHARGMEGATKSPPEWPCPPISANQTAKQRVNLTKYGPGIEPRVNRCAKQRYGLRVHDLGF